MVRFVIISLMIAGLTACSARINENRVAFDGIRFGASIDKGDGPFDFSVTIRRVSRSLMGAREAGRYEATVYCVNSFGTSDIIWDIGPDDESLNIVEDRLILKGQCDI